MLQRQKNIDAIKALNPFDKKPYNINWSEGGGGEVYRIWDTFFLFEIPQYGGEGYFMGSFSINELDDLINEAESRT